MKKATLLCSLEVLEQRIAPATLHFTDAAGADVTVTTSKGTDTALAAVATFANSGGGEILEKLSLASNPIFQGTNLTIAVTGNPSGLVDVGLIDATGLDLGNVVIAGDLGAINAGDAKPATLAIKKLEAASLAVEGTATQAAGGSIVDTIVGGIGTLDLHGDLDGTLLLSGGSNGSAGSIGTVQIDGSIVGGTASQSGAINASAGIHSIHVNHNVTGGAGPDSGSIFAGGVIGTLAIDGNVTGGSVTAALRSGRVASNGGMTTVTIGGNIQGGEADSSGQVVSGVIGSITVTGQVIGSDGLESGTIASSTFITKVHVVGGVTGGGGERSGSIRSATGMGSVVLDGDLTGGGGDNSGIIASDGPITSIVIHGSIVGGEGFQSGAAGSSQTIHSVLVTGNVTGGNGESSGQIVSKTSITSVSIQGSLNGGQGFESGAVGSLVTLGTVTIGHGINGGEGDSSGAVLGAGNITTVVVTGDVAGGSGFGSGIIQAQAGLQTVTIHGNLVGGEAGLAGAIEAGTALGTVTIDGNIVGGPGFIEEQGFVLINNHSPGLLPNGDFFGGGLYAGAVLSNGSIGTVVVGGAVEGGDGPSSGVIETIGPATSASDIGTIKIGGDVDGGAGQDSGVIFSAGHLGKVTLGTPGAIILRGLARQFAESQVGSLVAFEGESFTGDGEGSATIGSNLGLGTILITGSVIGGNGSESGKIVTGGSLASLTINGSLFGGSGGYNTTSEDEHPQLGQIYAAGTIVKATIAGEVDGGNSANSGEIRAGSIKTLVVGVPQGGLEDESSGDVFGGSGQESGAIVAEKGDIGSVTILGTLSSGEEGAFHSGSILAAHNIGTIQVGGISGNQNFAVSITAEGQLLPKSNAQALAIKLVTVKGNVAFANILAGYNIDGDGVNGDAQIGTVQTIKSVPKSGNADQGGSGTMAATNIVAGILPGEGGFYGSRDDQLITTSNNPDILSNIAKIIIAGGFSEEEVKGTFGFDAETVVSVVVQGTPISLHSGPHNDFVLADTNFETTFVNELPPPPP